MENKKLYCDLHTHSTRSDGELSRAEVIELAIENNIGALTITDHNIPFDDLDELQKKYPKIRLINGSEVSTSYHVPGTDEMKEIHVVALDFENTEYFVSILHQNRYDNQEFIGRMAIARKLVSLGLVRSIEEAFDEYIGDFGKRRAYVRPNIGKYIPMDTAIIEIKKAGGIPVLCHPYSYNLSEEQVVRLIQDFKNCGGLAMETLYSQYTSERQEKLKTYANEYGLLQSAASDFHGRGKKGSLDHHFPISIYHDIANMKEQLLASSSL